MFVTIILFLLFIRYLLIDVKKAIICAYPFCLLFTTLPLLSIGRTHIGFNFAIFICIIIVSFNRFWHSINRNPFLVPILLLVCGFLATLIFGAGRSSLYPLVSNIVSTIIPLFIYPYIRKKADVNLFIKWMCIVLLISVSYAIVEFMIGKNVWMYWLQSQTSDVLFHDHIKDIRFGYGRCNSFFDFPIPFGDICAIFFSFLLFYTYSFTKLQVNKFYIYLFMGFLVVGIILSNSRAPFLAFWVGLMHYPLFKYKKTLFFLFLIIIGIFYYASNSFYLIYDSIFGDNSAGVEGSSFVLRTNQLQYCFIEFQKNLYFGGGLNRMEELQGAIGGRELMGGESQLFVLMVNQGLAGIIPYFLSYFYMVFAFRKGQRRFPLFLSLAWMTAALASLTTGITIALPMLLLLVVYRSYRLGMIKK